ncbi:MAG: preprotein translocase subunit SecG [Defluviitaleaceae bacterium]|nr:preprotein translocase subunit SecG [Defluviitaleaceae bacterium]
MSILYIVLSVIYILACGGLVALILMQKKRSSGIGSVAGMGNADTYWDKNKGRSIEGTFEKWTKIGGAIILVFTVIMCLI